MLKKIFENLKKIKLLTLTQTIIAIIVGVITILTYVSNNKGNEPIVIPKPELISRFDENPSHDTNFGFLSINTFAKDGDNKLDALLVSELPENNEFIIFVDFRNKLPGTIKDAKGKLEFPKKGTSSTAKFKGILSAENSEKINDEIFLSDLSKNWKIEFVKGRLEVYGHKLRKNGKIIGECNDVFKKNFLRKYEIKTPDEMYIGDLRDYAQGWCDQGFLILTFKYFDLTKNNK